MLDRAVALGAALEGHQLHAPRHQRAGQLKDNTLAVLEYDKSMALISTAAKMANSSAHQLVRTDRHGRVVLHPTDRG